MGANLRFDVNANDAASATFLGVAAAAREARSELDRLDGKRVRARVEVQGATAQDAARLRQLSEALREIDGRNARARVDVSGTPDAATVRQLRATAKALRELDGANATARIDVGGDLPNVADLRATARALKQLQDIGVVAVRIEVSGAADELAAIIALGRALRDLPDEVRTGVRVDVDKSIADRLATLGKALVGIGAAGGLAAAGAINATAAVATLAGSLAQAAGVAPALVGALAGIGAIGATVAVGMKNFWAALGPRDTAAQIKKVDKAVAGLSANAKATVDVIRGFGPAWTSMRLDVQERLFAGMNREIQLAGQTYIPVLRAGMTGIAGELNVAAKSVAAFATSGQTVSDVNAIFANTKVALTAARPAAVNLLQAVRDIAVVGSGELPAMGVAVANLTGRFRDFIAQARESGQLKVWIDQGVVTLRTLGSVAGNVGGILYSVFTAAKASGADFLSTLDRVTGGIDDFLKGAQGQSALVAVFREARDVIDALAPGVVALGQAAAAAVRSFAESNGLESFARSVSGVAQAISPLVALLGTLAGSAFGALAGAASLATAALSPIVGAVSGVAGALGPLPGVILAAVVAFKLLASTAVAGSLAALATRIAAIAPAIGVYTMALTGSVGAGAAAAATAGRVGAAIGAMGKALPIVGVALVGLGALFDAVGPKAGAMAEKVVAGSLSMQQAIAQEAERNLARVITWDKAAASQDAYANATTTVTAKVQEQLAAMSPMQRLQAEVAMAQANLNDAVAQYGANTPQATAAAAALAGAQGKLKTAQDGVAEATKTATDRLREQADQMAAQINTALAYEQAVRRTAEAQKTAGDALKSSGANSDVYKGAVLDLAVAMSGQADAARKQAEALGGAQAGALAYNTEILKSANLSTQAGRDAFAQLAAGMDAAGLAALSAAANVSGLRTEVVTLPDGRKVTVVVEADRTKLDSVKKTVDELASSAYVGRVTIDGDPRLFRDKIVQSVTFANGTQANITIDGNGAPLEAQIGLSKYKIDSTTGVMTIDGNPGPGEANLSGMKLKVDATTGVMTLEANPAPADAKINLAKSKADTSVGTMTIEGNPTPVNGKITSAVTFANGSRGTVTIDGNQVPVNGKINASVTYANGSRGVIQVDANAAAANAAINNAARNRTTTIFVKYSGPAYTPTNVSAGRLATGGVVSPMAHGGVLGFASGGVGARMRLTPMRGDIAQRVPANTWRVIGDRMNGDEFFLPDDAKARSLAIGAEWARRRGFALVPRQASAAGTVPRATAAPTMTAARPAAAAALSFGPLLAEIQTLRGALSATAGGGDSAAVVAELRALRGPLMDAVRTSVATAAQVRRTSSELAGLR